MKSVQASRWTHGSSRASGLRDASAAALVAALDTEDPAAAGAASEAAMRAAAQSPHMETDAAAAALALAAASDFERQTAAAQQAGSRAAAAAAAEESGGCRAASTSPAPQHAPAARERSLAEAESAVVATAESEPAAFVHLPVHHPSHHRLALPTIYESEDAPAEGGSDFDDAAADGTDADAADGQEQDDMEADRRPFNWPIVWPSPGSI